MAKEVTHEGLDHFRPVGDDLFEIGVDFRPGMRVPIRLVADAALLDAIRRDRSLQQLANVATLPGVRRFVVGMPDMHEGYGFPVGGVAATSGPDAVISPGGIGFDINCGVRLLASGVRLTDLGNPTPLVHELSRSIPTGYGRHGRLVLEESELDHVLEQGCNYVVRERGFGFEADLRCIESGGALEGADPSKVSQRAKTRGHDQLGTLGGGNHFLEVQCVERIFDETIAKVLGLFVGQVTVMIHTGSRGLGHQVCTDYVRLMDEALAGYDIQLPDRQLACAPLASREGRDYWAAMCAAANYAWCNRQLLTVRVREAFRHVLGTGSEDAPRVVYDVAHNIAKLEYFDDELLCVHRKGATRAFGPSSSEVPREYAAVGQPVFIPGSMGTSSFVLVGTDAASEISLGSACHGAGRTMSRGQARRSQRGKSVRHELEARGIVVRCPSNSELAEEAPLAYKDVELVVKSVVRAGIAKPVAKLRPVGVLKG